MGIQKGFCGDIGYDDITVFVEELQHSTEDALHKFRQLFIAENAWGPHNTMPPWLQHPIGLHAKLTRWMAIEKRSTHPLGEREKIILQVLDASLVRLGMHLEDIAKQYVRGSLILPSLAPSQPSSVASSPSRNNPLHSEEAALGIRSRRSNQRKRETSEHLSNENTPGDVQTFSAEDIDVARKKALEDGFKAIQTELLHLHDVTSKLSSEIEIHQGGLDATGSQVGGAREMTERVNTMLREIVVRRFEWIPLGGTMLGVGIGALAGIPGGVVGVTVGALVGGTTVGGAATMLASHAHAQQLPMLPAPQLAPAIVGRPINGASEPGKSKQIGERDSFRPSTCREELRHDTEMRLRRPATLH